MPLPSPSLPSFSAKRLGLSGDLPSMSSQVSKQASSLRNVVNLDELKGWLGALGVERLGRAEPLSGEPPSDRLKLSGSWLSTVGRNWMARKGQATTYSPTGAEPESQAEWVKRAIQSGSPLQRLSLAASERELLAGILDWMRSEDGPSLASDWSKISVEQAERAEKEWIDAKVKAALKRDLDAADALGTELFAQSDVAGPDGRLGWRWMEVKSAGALDREGALMRHCVGSYAKDVAEESVSVYSLRDSENKPHLTIEASEGDLVQLKAFGNKRCPKELAPQVAVFVSDFLALCEKRGWKSGAVEDVEEFELVGVAEVRGFGLAVADKPTPPGWEARLNSELKTTESGRERANEWAVAFASLGWVELTVKAAKLAGKWSRGAAFERSAELGDLLMIQGLLPLMDPQERSTALFNAAKAGQVEVVKLLLTLTDPLRASQALPAAAEGGHVEMIKLLLPLSDPLADNSRALTMAAKGGHVEALKALLPVSDPLAGGSKAFWWAVSGGNVDVVKLLLPLSDLLAIKEHVLKSAVKFKKKEIEALLKSAISEAEERSSPSTLASVGDKVKSQRALKDTRGAKGQKSAP